LKIAPRPRGIDAHNHPDWHGHNLERFLKTPYPTGPVLPGGKIPELLRAYPNVYADLSAGSAFTALSRDTAFATDFLSEFQDRLLYARDYFDNRIWNRSNSPQFLTASTALTSRAAGRRAAPDWDWRSSRRSSRRTAGG